MLLTKLIDPRRWSGLIGGAVRMGQKVGYGNSLRLLHCRMTKIAAKDLRLPLQSRLCPLRIPGLRHPVWIRTCSSDVYVAHQAFGSEEHRCVGSLQDVRFIVDCGANVGYTAAYLLNAYPDAKLLAIEPDAANFAMLQRNLEPYGARAVPVHGAVWAKGCRRVKVDRGQQGDGLDWSVTVAPTADPTGVPAFDLDTLVADYAPAGRGIDLLKVDIEGAEKPLFEDPEAQWPERTHNLCVEPHGPGCEAAFEQLRRKLDGDESRHDELHVLLNIRPKATDR